MWTSPEYCSRNTSCISQCWFEGDPTLISTGFNWMISLAEVVSQTEHEYSRPIDLQWFCNCRWSSRFSSRNSRCSPYVAP